MWSYDEFEKAVLGAEAKAEEDETVLNHAVVYYTAKDYSVAFLVADALGGCAKFCRDAGATIHPEAKSAKHLVVVGGPEVTDHPNVKNCCGYHAEDTAMLAGQYASDLRNGR